MCGTNDLQLDLCYYKGQHRHEEKGSTTATPSHSRSSSSSSNNSVEKVWKETQQLMEDREQLVRIMTHVCSQQFSGAYRTLARYSQGCWRGCSTEGSIESRRGVPHHYVHPPPSPSPPSASRHPSCSASSSRPSSQMPPCSSNGSALYCKNCALCGCSDHTTTYTSTSSGCPTTRHAPHVTQEEETHTSSSSSSPSSSASSCRCRGGCSRRGRWRWGRCCQCLCARCHPGGCRRSFSSALTMGMDSGGPVPIPPPPPPPEASTLSRTSATHSHHSPVPCCPTATTTTTVRNRAPTKAGEEEEPSLSASQSYYAPARRTTLPPSSQARTASPKPRGGAPAHPSLLTILLLLVVTLARFTDGCSSRSTPKPRPASPTMRPNITFQTYACPPAYAAWYCLNGATCFTVKIGESILYNCECADGYMGQRCEFKDLDGSYLPAREKVLLETASIAGGATVAIVLVFIVLFALYVFMQKDKDKRCSDLDDRRDSDRKPFSGYQNPRPEVFRTISNPYARTLDELSHVEVESAGHGVNTGTGGRIGSGSTTSGGGNPLDSDLHHNSQQQSSSLPAS